MFNRDHRNVLVLGTCQMLFGTGRGLFMVTSPAVALAIAPHPALATLPTALVVVGTATAAMPASLFCRRVGRKSGFLVGTLLSAGCGAAATSAVIYQSFWFLAAAGLLFGLFSGFAQLYRFAVADAAPEHFRAKAISLVLAGGVFAGLAGPNLAIWGRSLIENQLFAGAFLLIIATALLSAATLLLLDIPDLTKAQREGTQRPIAEIVKQPVFAAAAISATVAQAVMNFLMTATPIAMIAQCGHSFSSTAGVIAWHTVAMFAPGFFTGNLIRRFGEINMIFAGLALETACIVVGLSGIEVIDFWLAMFLLGLGWNFTFTAATTLMTTAYTPAERAKTQGMMNQIIYTVVACGSLSSGALIHFFGWNWVNVGAVPFLIFSASVMVWYANITRKVAST